MTAIDSTTGALLTTRTANRSASMMEAVEVEAAEMAVVEGRVEAEDLFAAPATSELGCSAAGYRVKGLNLSPAEIEEADELTLPEGPPASVLCKPGPEDCEDVCSIGLKTRQLPFPRLPLL